MSYICSINEQQHAMNPTAASERLDYINNALNAGKSVIFSTYLRHIKVTHKTVASWKKSGNTLFKVSGDRLLMASGKNFVCIDGCTINIY
jgi:nicotinamide mononucleotide adenylyltransferase